MTYITQLIYLKPGGEEAFHQFEKVAIPIIFKYRGKLLLPVRPEKHNLIDGEMEHLMRPTWSFFHQKRTCSNLCKTRSAKICAFKGKVHPKGCDD